MDLPIPTAIKLAEGGRITLGWTRCRLKLLEKARPTCHRCGKSGHFILECSREPVAKRCYHCHKQGHLARNCGVLSPGEPTAGTESIAGDVAARSAAAELGALGGGTPSMPTTATRETGSPVLGISTAQI